MMSKFWNLAVSALCTAIVLTPVAADSKGSYLWDPVVDNEANVYARVIELKHAGNLNGKLLATWEHWYTEGPESSMPDGVPGELIIRESNDKGNTWTTLTTVTDTQTGPGHPTAQIWQPFMFEFPHQIGAYPEGTLLLVANLFPENRSFTEFFTWRSLDHGETWNSVGAWQEGGKGTTGIWEPFLYLDRSGSLVAAFSDERDGENHSQMLVHVVSEDGGDTWGELVHDVVSSAQSDRPGMPTITLMDNGQYLMTFEICGRANCPIYAKTSEDGVTWDVGDLGTRVVTPDGLYVGATPYTIWDDSTKQLVLGARSALSLSSNALTAEHYRMVLTNKNYGVGPWSWSPSPWHVNNASEVCNSNYSPHLLPLSNGVIRYTAPTSEGNTGLCSVRTGAAPIGALPYQADFAANGQLGWINYGGQWTVSGDEYVVTPVGDNNSRAVTGSTGWTDYEISADVFISGSSGVVGLSTRVSALPTSSSSLKGYTAAINTFTGNLTVSRIADSMVVLNSHAYPGGILGDKWYRLSLAVKDDELTATVSCGLGCTALTYTTTDTTYNQGMAGLWANVSGGQFKNVEIYPI